MTPSHYVFIESRDPFESTDGGFVIDAATELHGRGRPVAVFLVQNAVLAARAGARGTQLPRLAEAGVEVLADGFSLAERGIEAEEMRPGVHPSSIEALVDLLTRPGTKAVWH